MDIANNGFNFYYVCIPFNNDNQRRRLQNNIYSYILDTDSFRIAYWVKSVGNSFFLYRQGKVNPNFELCNG